MAVAVTAGDERPPLAPSTDDGRSGNNGGCCMFPTKPFCDEGEGVGVSATAASNGAAPSLRAHTMITSNGGGLPRDITAAGWLRNGAVVDSGGNAK